MLGTGVQQGQPLLDSSTPSTLCPRRRNIARKGGREPLSTAHDTSNDAGRSKLVDLCQDCGPGRIQHSALVGDLSRSHEDELLRESTIGPLPSHPSSSSSTSRIASATR